MESDEEYTVRTWGGKRAESYGKNIKASLENDDGFWTEQILSRAPKKKVLRILDVGTGPGYFAIILSKAGHEVTGVDVTPDMIKVAKENGPGLDFRVMNADKLDFEDDTFDLIVSRVVTWTIPNMYECYREWRRVLAPGGRVLVFDSNFRIRFFDPSEEKRIRKIAREEALKCDGVYSGFVGYHIREKYWEERPMIGTVRPQWDRNALIKLRYKDITVEDQIFDEPDTRRRICPVFAVTATKPTPEEEIDLLLEEHWDGMGACNSAYTSAAVSSGRADAYVESIKDRITGKKVLDLGCGCGMVSIALSKAGYKVTGADLSANMLEEARLCAREADCKVKFVKAKAHSLPFKDGSFNTVVCRNSFWFFHYPGQVLSEISRVLKKGGSVIITDNEWMSDLDSTDTRYTPHLTSQLGLVRVNLGYGGYDIIDDILREFPQNNNGNLAYMEKEMDSRFQNVEIIKPFSDPAVHDDLKGLVQNQFCVIARRA